MTEPIIRRALISVSDKTGLIDLARALAGLKIEIVSTGGTAKAIKEAGIPVREISDLTGLPEMLDGRVKTLHPKVHGGILAIRGAPEHDKAVAQHQIPLIDLVVVNLYPFAATVAKGADFETCIENIDIGGPALLRAAAKNHDHVAVLADPGDYPALIAELSANTGATTLALRRRLAAAAFTHTSAYDAAISHWFHGQLGEEVPSKIVFGGALKQSLRYGENPHQKAALYISDGARPGVANARQLQGKELSYNNINDTDAAFELVSEFDRPAVAIIKHANPCGVAEARGDGSDSLVAAYKKALACDPVSAFGGIIALNRKLDGKVAAEIAKLFTEVVIAPDADDDARAIFAAKKNLRLLVTGGPADKNAPAMMVRSVSGGLLVQGRDTGHVTANDVKIVTKRPPTPGELADMLFAFTVAKHVKSNAIVYAKDGATVGVGAGQMSRVDSARIAAWKSREAAGEAEPGTKGSVVASDAFFPFPDGLLATIEAGATAVIQPGGSIKDQDVIDAANEKGVAMVFTGMRHFRH
jgi:phosphoribosylaminoimidazolecarboxamide formyltransferase/IMP cyclohydrolase